MDVVLAFAATLVSLRLAAELVRRWRTRRTPDLLVWGASLAAFAVASAALAWGAAAGWDDRAFRVYYLFGALLTAPLLGAGSLFRTRLPRTPLAIGLALYVGLAVGVALAMQIDPAVSGSDLPEPGDHLDFVPARVVALVGNVTGTVAAVVVASMGIKRRPVGNTLIVAGVIAAALGSAVAGLAAWGGSAFTIVAAVLLYAGFVSRR
jgi:uncharacterized membrane protein